jgi:hypothetical protein
MRLWEGWAAGVLKFRAGRGGCFSGLWTTPDPSLVSPCAGLHTSGICLLGHASRASPKLAICPLSTQLHDIRTGIPATRATNDLGSHECRKWRARRPTQSTPSEPAHLGRQGGSEGMDMRNAQARAVDARARRLAKRVCIVVPWPWLEHVVPQPCGLVRWDPLFWP